MIGWFICIAIAVKLTILFSRLTAANCFNGSNGLRVRVIDKRSGTVQTGKADGLKSISLEVLDTFGTGNVIRNESHRAEEVFLWEPDAQGGVERSMTPGSRVGKAEGDDFGPR
jgi:phenol 2-monooxygenase